MRKGSNKRKTLIIIVAAMLVAGIGFSAGMLAKESMANRNGDIGIDKAREIALASVGVTDEKATFTKAVLDDNVYDIEFHTESNEYDFEVDADTGAIASREVAPRDLALPEDTADKSVPEKDAVNESAATQSTEAAKPSEAASATKAPAEKPSSESAPASKPDSGQQNDSSVIGTAAAKNIALKHAGLSSASFIKAHLDYDDGIRVYDIEFNAGGRNYEYEINAHTGKIMDYDVEGIDYDDDDDDDDDYDDD